MREIKTLLDTFTDVSFDLENENAKKVIRKVAEFYKNDYNPVIHDSISFFSKHAEIVENGTISKALKNLLISGENI